MKTLKRFETFLWRYSMIFYGALLLLGVFWATQLYTQISKLVAEEIAYQKQRDPEAEQQRMTEATGFIEDKIKAAEQKGISYGPADYFADLELIYQKKYHQVPFGSTDILHLQRFAIVNVDKGYFTEEDLERARRQFKGALLDEAYYRSSMPAGESLQFNLHAIVSWFVTLYCRALPLVFLFYLVRMADWRGILKTFLAGKQKFFLAVVVWPFYLLRYPSNVVREIRVEAELRRMGALFRKLTFQEQAKVRRIANSDYYHFWVVQVGCRSGRRLQRSLLIAVLATIALRCVQPIGDVHAFLATHSGSDPPVLHSLNIGGQNTISVGSDPTDQFGDMADVVLPAPPHADNLWLSHRRHVVYEKVYRQTSAQETDHVPLSWLFGLKFHETVMFTK